MLNHTCKECNNSYKTEKGLFQHIRRSHDAKKYYVKYIDNSVHKCSECNSDKQFVNLCNGFKYICNNTCSRKQRQRNDKRRKTCQKRYGSETYNNPNKANETILNKYGNEPYFRVGSTAFKDNLKLKHGSETYNNPNKIKQTKLEKYGDENYNNRKKSKITCLNEYGVDNIMKTEIHRNRISNREITDDFRLKMRDVQFKNTWNWIVGDRFKGEVVIQNETKDSFKGVSYEYTFKCERCDNIFKSDLISKRIPRCLKCYPLKSGTSKGEIEIINFLKSKIQDIKIIHRDRNVLGGKEIDIYLPEYKLGIEYNGIHWHSESNGKTKYYHKNKTDMCNNNGIDLIHIFDVEWEYQTEIVKSILLNRLGIPAKKIYGRKCKVKSLNNKTTADFLNTYHLQGSTGASIKYGLYYDDELLSVMTFSKSRYSKKYDYEVVRYSTNGEFIVVGGAEKLFNYFVKNNLKENESIISYCDIRYFTGKIYERMGFDFSHNSYPNYHYIKNNKLYSRILFQKHKLQNILLIFDSNLTERENMIQNGYDRIWDCGNKVFIFNKK